MGEEPPGYDTVRSILLPQHTDGALAVSFAVMTDSLHAALALAETLKDMSPTQMDTYVQAAAPAMGALGAFAAFATLLVSDVVVEALPNTCSYYKAHAYSGEAFPWGEVTWSERIGVGASDRADRGGTLSPRRFRWRDARSNSAPISTSAGTRARTATAKISTATTSTTAQRATAGQSTPAAGAEGDKSPPTRHAVATTALGFSATRAERRLRVRVTRRTANAIPHRNSALHPDLRQSLHLEARRHEAAIRTALDVTVAATVARALDFHWRL